MRHSSKAIAAALVLASVCSICVAADTATTQPFKLKIGFDTTRVDGPLLPDGTIDYSTAMWEKMSAGVTDENNAAPLLEKAFASWKELDAGVPDGDLRNQMEQHFDEARDRPWKQEEFPDVAAWLQTREKDLMLVAEVSWRAHFCPTRPAPGELVNIQGFKLGNIGSASMALKARAMMYIATGNQEGARADVLTIHRLSLLLADVPAMLGILVALPLDADTRSAQLAALRASDKENAVKWLRQRLEMQPVRMQAATIDVDKRYADLSITMVAIRGNLREAFEDITALNLEGMFTDNATNKAIVPGNLNEVDWNVVLRHINAADDEASAIFKQTDLLERMAAARRFSQSIKNEKVPGNLFTDVALDRVTDKQEGTLEQRMTRQRDIVLRQIETFVRRGEAETIDVYSLRIAQFFVHPSSLLDHVIAQAERNDAENQIYTAAMGLEVYKIQNGNYPETLGALVPGILGALPLDLYSGKSPIYRREGAGYLIYSIGPNGLDDKGEKAIDDIVVRSQPK